MKIYKYATIKRTNFVAENDTTNNPAADPKVKLLLSKIKNMESGSQESVEDFLTCLRSNFGIQNVEDLNIRIYNGCTDVSSESGGIMYKFGSSVTRAIRFATQLVKKIDPKYFGGYVAGAATVGLVVGGFSFFTIMAMSIIASCAAMVFFKMYKAIKKADISESTSLDVVKYNTINMTKFIIESNLVFDKLNRVVESECLTENGSTEVTIDGIITRSYSLCRDMFMWIRDKISRAFTATSNFVERNPKFITIVLFCIGLVMAYSGCSMIKDKLFSSTTVA